MDIITLRNAIIPELAAYINAPLIAQDGEGEKPKGQHATYKITTSYGRGTGRENEYFQPTAESLTIKTENEYRTTFSFSAYSMDDDESYLLAQKIYDWFAFVGYDFLNQLGATVTEQTDIINRDAFIVENYERRNGFDVIIRVIKENTRNVDWFDKVEIVAK
jgi:hypothetical protein